MSEENETPTPDQLEDIRGDVYLWKIGELTAEQAIASIAETLGY